RRPYYQSARPSRLYIRRNLPNHPPPPEIYTLSLHDALPISKLKDPFSGDKFVLGFDGRAVRAERWLRDQSSGLIVEIIDQQREIDRKSTRLNSSHVKISYAVFCLKKKTADPTPSKRAPVRRT